MSISLVVFDLDGVLIDSKKIHFNSLNHALKVFAPGFEISWSDHNSVFDGLPTRKKLIKLNEVKGLDPSLFDEIVKLKNRCTRNALLSLEKDEDLMETLSILKNKTDHLIVASNSIKETVDIVCNKLGIDEFLTMKFSNEDVVNPKPHPEIYWKAMMSVNADPNSTLIIEDSVIGLEAAHKSGAHVFRVRNRSDVSISNILPRIIAHNPIKKVKWVDPKLNVLIPMAGRGSRFENAGYIFPKPLIEIYGKPMIQQVVENLNIEANYIFIVQKNHLERYNLSKILDLIVPGCKIVVTDGQTEGAACSALLAEKYINFDYPLLIANSDQIVDWDSSDFMYCMERESLDGGIAVFNSVHPKWSFVRLNELGYVDMVAEKDPISNIATVGIYYWKKGSDFVESAKSMITKNLRYNNEFYICPVYNIAINQGSKIGIRYVKKMWGVGTPEDLNQFLIEYKDDYNIS